MQGNVQNLKFSVNKKGNKKPPVSLRPTTHKMLEEQIRNQKQLDEWVIEELINMSKNYPDSALDTFAQNINKMIAKAQEKKRETEK